MCPLKTSGETGSHLGNIIVEWNYQNWLLVILKLS